MTWEAMTCDELKLLAEAAGERQGWDFSRVREARDPAPWDYAEVVGRYARPADRVLDIGTGGGERFLALAAHYGRGVGIDALAAMVETARRNTPASLAERIWFGQMDAEALGFPDASFGLVLNRQANLYPGEIARVLRRGGYFISQQVGRRNTANVLAAFGWGPESFGDDWWQDLSAVAEEFRRNGCAVVARGEYDIRTWFLDVESFLFWLKAAPLPETFDLDRHWQAVNRVLVEYGSTQGIETNEHRELLIVQKRC